MIEELLKNKNLKQTKQRIEILKLIEKLDINATKKNILENTNIDKSTVYRTLETLIENNIIEKSINHKNELYYEIKQEHKHYIKCIKCHKKEEIHICPVKTVEKKGFKIVSHKIEIDGICNTCQKSE